jgi:hypothetical protein
VQERQRTVLVIASGLALAVLAVTVNRLLLNADGGWFAYAPNSGVTYAPSSRVEIWREAVVWLAGVGMWTGFALWIFRRPRSNT